MMREIGRTGIKVVPIGLGAMPLSIEGRPSEAQACKVIETFVKLGGNFIDTANVYCLYDADIGHNERLIHQALTELGEQDRVVIATKGGLRRPQGRWVIDGDPAWIRQSCEKSLRDLQTDAITLYQLHAVDPKFGWQPSVEELIHLREEGKIRYIGLSNVSLDILRSALAHTPIQSVQNRCNPFEKDDFKNGMIEFCRSNGITYIPNSQVGGHSEHTVLAQNGLLQHLAAKYGASAYCIVLAWFLAKGEHIVPIPGASRVASIEDSMRALSLKLDPADIQAIDALPDKT